MSKDTPRSGPARLHSPRGPRRGTSRITAGARGRRPGTTDDPLIAVNGPLCPPPVARFEELALPAPLLAELVWQGVTVPFPIQGATLPSSLSGRDVLGRGRTGSGKTLAFGLAVLARTAGRRAEQGRPLALILVPTRELAQQVTDALAPYARAVRLRLATVVGGVSMGRQDTALRGGVDVVVATPGRLRT